MVDWTECHRTALLFAPTSTTERATVERSCFSADRLRSVSSLHVGWLKWSRWTDRSQLDPCKVVAETPPTET